MKKLFPSALALVLLSLLALSCSSAGASYPKPDAESTKALSAYFSAYNANSSGLDNQTYWTLTSPGHYNIALSSGGVSFSGTVVQSGTTVT
ncbi:MAG TPA: hypothetical protein VFL04_04800, partial [Rectinemataceae bacterium]|nr:hypothetical protein [Rectinemataceae bacterium]